MQWSSLLKTIEVYALYKGNDWPVSVGLGLNPATEQPRQPGKSIICMLELLSH